MREQRPVVRSVVLLWLVVPALVTAAVVGLYFYWWQANERTGTRGLAGVGGSPAPPLPISVLPTLRYDARIAVAGPARATHLDLTAATAWAERVARRFAPDAVLVSMSCSCVRPDGTLDAQSGPGVVRTLFMSPQRVARSEVDLDRSVALHVELEEGTPWVRPRSSSPAFATAKPIAVPSECNAARAIATAMAAGHTPAPCGWEVSLAAGDADAGAARWTVRGAGAEVVVDAALCAPATQ